MSVDDPKLIKLKDDLRSLMSSELRLIDATIDALQKPETAVSEGDKEILNTTMLMYQGLGVSIHSVLRLTEFPDMAIKDCFSIARGIVEASINIAYIISSKPDIVTQPPDPGRLIGDSVRLSFWLGVGGQGPLSGALA